MQHVNYSGWVDHILALYKWHSGKRLPVRVLDAACGTGNFILEFLSREIRVDGFDGSAEMLAQFEQKLIQRNIPDMTFWQDDIVQFSADKEYELIYCLFDSMNYLADKEQLVESLSNFRKYLSKAGILIFDMATPFLCQTYYADTTDIQKVDGHEIHRFCEWKESSFELETRFNFIGPSETYRQDEIHLQHIFTVDETIMSIYNAGFAKASVYGDFTKQPPHPDSLRNHFVAVA